MLSLSEAARTVPSNPHPSTIWRWCRRGVKSRAGGRIYLRHSRFGGKVFVEPADLDRFGRELAEADAAHFEDAADAGAERPVRVGNRAAEIEAAERELDEAGI